MLRIAAKFNQLFCVAALVAGSAIADDAPDCGRYSYKAQLVRVIDGVIADVDLGFNTWRKDVRLRLLGVDTPEKGEKGFEVASDALTKKLRGKQLFICIVNKARSDGEKLGSFGRDIAIVFVDGESVNDWLLSEGYAVPYAE